MSSSLTINRKTREKRVAAASGKYSGSLWAWITKIALLGILDAIAVYGVMTAIAHSSPRCWVSLNVPSFLFIKQISRDSVTDRLL